MKRNYKDIVKDDVNFFVGTEIEHTPAWGYTTLFVVGIQDVDYIKNLYHHNNCEHIFFGANHSFNPGLNFPDDAEEWERWDKMILTFLDEGYLVSLDIPLTCAETILESRMIESNNFIPQIRVPLPYIEQYNYNTMIKLDDKGFNATNPGIWTHSLHDLKDKKAFTSWKEYSNDKPLDNV